ncbi:hypothetical protein TNCV_2682611 [Trichonephila clavipes]|nr:hypothetical protein TNCV_2682611 [Trichonephila clavipes]
MNVSSGKEIRLSPGMDSRLERKAAHSCFMLGSRCSIGDRCGDLAGQGNMSTLQSTLRYNNCMRASDSLVASPFPSPPSDQHLAITGTKAEPSFIRKHNRCTLRPPMLSGMIPLASQTVMESVEYMLQGAWLGAVLELTDF